LTRDYDEIGRVIKRVREATKKQQQQQTRECLLRSIKTKTEERNDRDFFFTALCLDWIYFIHTDFFKVEQTMDPIAAAVTRDFDTNCIIFRGPLLLNQSTRPLIRN
jgi:hypothetical protein